MNKLGLTISRFLISHLPKGKSIGIKIALRLFGNKFNGVITSKDGRKFYIDTVSLVKQQLFFVNEYEDYETRLIRKIVKPGDYAFDVGASYGWYTTLLSKLVGSSGRVFAFELVPSIVEECRKNIKLNHMEGNIVLESLALGETTGIAPFIYSESLGLGNLNPNGLSGGGELSNGIGTIVSLDQYIEEHAISKLSFIKCDIDGAEVIFLKGARKSIATHRPVILIEASGAHGRPSSAELFKELDQLNYCFFSLHYRHRLKPIERNQFNDNFKENVLCLPIEKSGLISELI